MEEQNKNKSIKTFASDMAETIEQSGGGLVKKMIHEQEDLEAEKKKYSPESAKNRAFTVGGFALVCIGLVAIILITLFQKEAERVDVPAQFVPLIFTNKTDFIDVTDFNKTKITTALRTKAASLAMPGGEVAGIYFAEGQKIIGFEKFLSVLESNFPPKGMDLVENNFFTGIWGRPVTAEGESAVGEIFFVLKVSSFVNIFPVMREWENKMFHDLGLFFQDGTSPAYSTLLTANFEDGWVLNKNARFLSDDAGGLALMYVFVDDRTVVIASSFDAAEEAILRISAGDIRK